MKNLCLKDFENFKISNLNAIQGEGSYPQRRSTSINGGGYVYEFADGSYYYEFHNGESFAGSDWSPGSLLYQ